jgi:hypothetical protein
MHEASLLQGQAPPCLEVIAADDYHASTGKNETYGFLRFATHPTGRITAGINVG